ncbi:MAG: hypothetical protein WEA24_00675 [Gemmatimonadota bacterium]
MAEEGKWTRAMKVMRLSGLAVIFVIAGLANDAQITAAEEGCSNVFKNCTSDPQCDDVKGDSCNAGTVQCPGQYVCGGHENCDEDPSNPVALWCMVDNPPD